MAFISLLLAVVQTAAFTPPRLERNVPVEHSLHISGTAWIVLTVHTGKQGEVRAVEVLEGTNPLLDVAVANVRQWGFSPARAPLPLDSRLTVIYVFRARELFSAMPERIPQTAMTNFDRGPIPAELTDPGYPVNSVGEGPAVVELQISSDGAIRDSRIVSDAAGLAAHTEKAVRSWKFLPAMQGGIAVAGNVVLVATYLRPVINATAPSFQGPYVPNPNPAPPPPAVFRGKPDTPVQPK
jgi:hypothetical protein